MVLTPYMGKSGMAEGNYSVQHIVHCMMREYTYHKEEHNEGRDKELQKIQRS